MGDQHKLRVPVELDQVRVACDFVTAKARELGLSDDAVFHCELSVEEIVTNVVEHAFDNTSDKTQNAIEIIVEAQSDQFQIAIIDNAPPFNPLMLNDPDPNKPLDERVPGGWGVYFVKQFMNDVRYRYENNRNHLILVKKLR